MLLFFVPFASFLSFSAPSVPSCRVLSPPLLLSSTIHSCPFRSYPVLSSPRLYCHPSSIRFFSCPSLSRMFPSFSDLSFLILHERPFISLSFAAFPSFSFPFLSFPFLLFASWPFLSYYSLVSAPFSSFPFLPFPGAFFPFVSCPVLAFRFLPCLSCSLARLSERLLHYIIL